MILIPILVSIKIITLPQEIRRYLKIFAFLNNGIKYLHKVIVTLWKNDCNIYNLL